jgi:hypothetical protein
MQLLNVIIIASTLAAPVSAKGDSLKVVGGAALGVGAAAALFKFAPGTAGKLIGTSASDVAGGVVGTAGKVAVTDTAETIAAKGATEGASVAAGPKPWMTWGELGGKAKSWGATAFGKGADAELKGGEKSWNFRDWINRGTTPPTVGQTQPLLPPGHVPS